VTAALKNKTFEEIMAMWGRELEDQTTTFRSQALELSKWDTMLLDNSGKVPTLYSMPWGSHTHAILIHLRSDQIMALHGSVKKVEVAQKTLDSNLEIISRQQDELHQLVTSPSSCSGCLSSPRTRSVSGGRMELKCFCVSPRTW
jgi:hypothetical protein